MKTILTKKSNGLNIVIGFGLCSMDPIATRKKAEPLLAATPIHAAVNDKITELKAIVTAADQAMQESRKCLMRGDKTGAEINHKKYLDFEPIHKTKEQELGLLLPDLDKKIVELYEQEAIYFELKEGEFLVSPEHFEVIKGELNSLTSNQSLNLIQSSTGTITTEKIPDFVGQTYFILVGTAWEKHTINLIGELIPSGGILEADLSTAQKAEIELQELKARIATLTPTEKASELQIKTDELLLEANKKRSLLEIQKVATALTDSQAWYETELAKLTALYA